MSENNNNFLYELIDEDIETGKIADGIPDPVVLTEDQQQKRTG